ncbi:hypothetical protein B0A48_10081 [Cryoendolithus antarcticus]|uniref:Uncharacterized protein n=1 Tax=Cryoendolithus antarcticus TaxID=1507870 RepID=A0A1V8SWR5_9PEZI|nr:hypothetical protein B0A48_10081 [Cryoendolithus antarcticus]
MAPGAPDRSQAVEIEHPNQRNGRKTPRSRQGTPAENMMAGPVMGPSSSPMHQQNYSGPPQNYLLPPPGYQQPYIGPVQNYMLPPPGLQQQNIWPPQDYTPSPSASQQRRAPRQTGRRSSGR